jgi:hypothetical protein
MLYVLSMILSENRITFPDHALERCSATKLEFLDAIELTFGKRDRIVEPQRTER